MCPLSKPEMNGGRVDVGQAALLGCLVWSIRTFLKTVHRSCVVALAAGLEILQKPYRYSLSAVFRIL